MQFLLDENNGWIVGHNGTYNFKWGTGRADSWQYWDLIEVILSWINRQSLGHILQPIGS